MFGLVGKLVAHPGKRDDLADLLLRAAEAVAAADGSRLYLVSISEAEPDSVWVTEVWDSREAHRASLEIDAVKALIAEGMPLIAGMGESIELQPLGGFGLGA